MLLQYAWNSHAATVDTINIRSSSMSKDIKCVIIKPSNYKKQKKRYPVVYLLHGYSGSYNNWIIKVPELKNYADEYRLIIVCPDGDYASWYFDSRIKPGSFYETYIASELPQYVDSAYRTIKTREARAITGLSMGGHGALYLAWRHPDIFSSAGSMSGGVDLSESRNRFAIEKIIGDSASAPIAWRSHSMLNVVENIPSPPLALIIDCGVSDIFINGNRKFHQKLLDLKVAHEYIERKGQHNWEYWKYAVHFQLLFFRKQFDNSKLN